MSDEYMLAALALQSQQNFPAPPTGPDEPADEQQTEQDIQTVLQNFPGELPARRHRSAHHRHMQTLAAPDKTYSAS